MARKRKSSQIDNEPAKLTAEADTLNLEAIALIKRALDGWDDSYGAGSMSCAVYDTAWLSMITKRTGGTKEWLFPESFKFLLDTQAEDGGWRKDDSTQIDGILNTAASLLSLKRHLAEPLNILSSQREDLFQRTERATHFLRAELAVWRVSTTTHVGFEIIVPALLKYLSEEDSTLEFKFEGRSALARINAIKMSRFKPAMLYSPAKLTALHSLEAFIGMIDFDKVAHHKVQGSMMASPSSTAAYLMNVSEWDDQAEAYLRHVVKFGSGKGTGGVASAFPSMHFEYTWILSTLLKSGFVASDLDCVELGKMKNILVSAFEEENGVIGFAPRVGADVDDTAKGIISLQELGYKVDPQKMLGAFESETHFKTYALERDPSFSANTNALLMLLAQPDVSRFREQILKATNFLCDHWWGADDGITDKWNVCYLYPSVLFVEAFLQLLTLVEQKRIDLETELRSRVAISLFEACLRAMLGQKEDGSWNNSAEETSYGVLILTKARHFAPFDHIREDLESAINRGVSFIHSTKIRAPSHIWVEKVNYSSPHLHDCYVLAALKAASTTVVDKVGSTFIAIPRADMYKQIKLFQLTPLFSAVPTWQLRASMLEASLFQPLLHARRLAVFPRKDMEEDKYFNIIPFTWTACNNRTVTLASTSFIFEMMIISFLNYQADEFMEAVAGEIYTGKENFLSQLIDDTFNSESPRSNGHVNGDKHRDAKTNGTKGGHSSNHQLQVLDYEKVREPLSKFVEYVSTNPSVLAASLWDRQSTKRELRTFLHAHITQCVDNARFRKQSPGDDMYIDGTDSFFKWVRTTSADHTSCPYSFSFVSCLLSAMDGGRECFATVDQKYLASSMCRHLATMCRMYNDYGSIARDKAERNLNSVNFPEFGTVENSVIAIDSKDAKKKALFKLAEYERSCLNDALERLSEEVGTSKDGQSDTAMVKKRQMVIWRMFCDVTDLYGQIYVVRDIASSMVKATMDSGKRQEIPGV